MWLRRFSRVPLADLPTGTVTFLFTDAEASTRLLHELGTEAYAKALAGHRRVIRRGVASHGGVEVDTQGDAFLFVFSSAEDAVAAASPARGQSSGQGARSGAPSRWTRRSRMRSAKNDA